MFEDPVGSRRRGTAESGTSEAGLQEDPRHQSAVAAERAILVGLILPGESNGGTRYDPLAELAALASAAGAEVVGRVIQRRRTICPSTFIGTGKVGEVAAHAEEREADVVIFDNDLSPSQIREIEEVVGRKVLDRTELILDIFASRARTHAARLQVELAQLEYTAPRLRGMWTHLERIAGAGGGTAAGAVGGIGTRGPGERQIEIDRRLVQKRVTQLRAQLEKIDRRKMREVRGRSDQFTISLVGYTNAGKSTLMRALTGADAYVADALFATLDTKTRRWELGGGRSALLSDTVGFIRNLPHHLVASFRATLEEAIHADLLIHVLDGSSHDAQGQASAVERVLEELGCRDTPTLMAINKVDAAGDDGALEVLAGRYPQAIHISARTGAGLDALRDAVIDRMQGRFVHVTIGADSANGRLFAYVRKHGHVLAEEYDGDRVRLELQLPPQEVPRVLQLGATVLAE